MQREFLTHGSQGPSVAELHDRLRLLGYAVNTEASRVDDQTVEVVRQFQRDRGLEPDGQVGPATWHSLIEAAYRLGDRLICLTSPMTRGDDVADLQMRLGALGFDVGKTDGIYGPNTAQGVRQFQINAGLVPDEVVGPEVIRSLQRYGSRGGTMSIAGIIERERHRDEVASFAQAVVAVCSVSEFDSLAGLVAARLGEVGANAHLVHNTDWSSVAKAANQLHAKAVIALVVTDEPVFEISYFAHEGFESFRGQALAQAVFRTIPSLPFFNERSIQGMRHPILRETIAPTVRIKLGPHRQLEDHFEEIAVALTRATDRWFSEIDISTSSTRTDTATCS